LAVQRGSDPALARASETDHFFSSS
jgi:hypothetical protein